MIFVLQTHCFRQQWWRKTAIKWLKLGGFFWAEYSQSSYITSSTNETERGRHSNRFTNFCHQIMINLTSSPISRTYSHTREYSRLQNITIWLQIYPADYFNLGNISPTSFVIQSSCRFQFESTWNRAIWVLLWLSGWRIGCQVEWGRS